jgi:transposase-like protein
MVVSFKGAHFPQDIILMGVRWYVAYPLSYRHVEELMEERGVHSLFFRTQKPAAHVRSESAGVFEHS